MIPGTILFDNNFEFNDGTRGRKLLVVLTDGTDGYHVVIKTTSNPNYKGNKFGCQHDDRYPNFFLPAGSCCLDGQSWLQLDQYFEFSSAEFLSWHFSGRINRIGVLPAELTLMLLRCALETEDISERQLYAVSDMLQQLTSDKSGNDA